MKKISLVLLSLVFISLTGIASEFTNGNNVFSIDSEESKITWTGKKVTGEHTGTLMLESGKVYVDGNNLAMADVKMDMNSIVCLDLTNAEWNKKLVDHLKSDDFFSVENHPYSSFEATGFKATEKEGEYIVTGELTIKGITNDVSFPAVVEIGNGKLSAKGTAKIDRTKYDIKYGSGSFFKGLGDNMIYDNFEIEFNLVAKSDAV